MDEEYIINIPVGALKSKDAKMFVFNELNNCFLKYNEAFGIYPNEIKFNGKRGKIMYNLVKDIFKGSYDCSENEFWNDSIVFKNNKITTVNTKDLKPKYDIDEDAYSLDGKIVSGIHGSDIISQMPINIGSINNIEKDIPTEMEFMIYDEESQNIDLSKLADYNINLF